MTIHNHKLKNLQTAIPSCPNNLGGTKECTGAYGSIWRRMGVYGGIWSIKKAYWSGINGT